MTRILLAGGTGTVGREVAKGLVARGLVPRVLSRDPENARRLLATTVEVVRGDFTGVIRILGRKGSRSAVKLM